MRAAIAISCLALGVGVILFVPTIVAPFELDYGKVTTVDCAKAVAMCAFAALIAGFIISRNREHGSFLLKLFVLALLVRLVIGTVIFIFRLQDFFGGDAWAYNAFGFHQLQAWGGDRYAQIRVDQFTGTGFYSGWGMVYLVAAIYGVIGRNMLAIQFLNSVLGAATAPLVFMIAHEVFKNRRVAILAGIAVGFYPSMVLWSAQGLKDGPIVFFLTLSILATLKIGQRFSGLYLSVLILSLFGILSFRFYVFYMLLVAIVGSFIVGMRKMDAQSLFRQFLVIILLGLALTYLGVTRYASVQIDRYANLQTMQLSRLDAATSAQSGFGQDVDVSTTSGALATIPMGVVYLLFAPFPWQLGSLRQSITLPEMIVWWAVFPLLVLGLWFSLKHRLRQMMPILIFTSMLTLAYSIFQGNVGTAYRQRAQLLVFYFIFVGVGAVLVKEKREDRRRRAAEKLRLASAHLKATLLTRRPPEHV